MITCTCTCCQRPEIGYLNVKLCHSLIGKYDDEYIAAQDKMLSICGYSRLVV